MRNLVFHLMHCIDFEANRMKMPVKNERKRTHAQREGNREMKKRSRKRRRKRAIPKIH